MKMTNKNSVAKSAQFMQSLCCTWAMDERQVRELVRRVAETIKATPSSTERESETRTPAVRRPYELVNGVARIPVIGVLTKYATWWDGFYGLCPAEDLIKLCGAAFDDAEVKSIALDIDSPGGMAAGTVLAAQYIRQRRQETGKEVVAIGSDLICSGAYWIAAACNRITCNDVGEVGSIGVYQLWQDDTKFWADLGITYTLVTSGGVKGLGADGKVTPELVEEAQRSVDALYEQFVAWVAVQRGMTADEAKELANGRVWIAGEALTKRLIDEVKSPDAAYAAQQERTAIMERDQFIKYATEHPDHLKELAQPLIDKAITDAKPKNATDAELKAAFADDRDFVWERIGVSAPLADHKVAYADHLKDKLTKSQQTIDERDRRLAEIDPAQAGVTQPVGTKTEEKKSEKTDLDKAYEEDKKWAASQRRG
jgi:signal peptide peptidase SppA